MVDQVALAPIEIDTFTDDDTSEFEGYVEAIALARITLGPAREHDVLHRRPVTRGQTAAFLARALDLPEASRHESLASDPVLGPHFRVPPSKGNDFFINDDDSVLES